MRERLGRAGIIRFLGQFENGGGNYVKDRHNWVDSMSLADIQASSRRLKQKKKA